MSMQDSKDTKFKLKLEVYCDGDADYRILERLVSKTEVDNIVAPVIEAFKLYDSNESLHFGERNWWLVPEWVYKSPHDLYAGILTTEQIEQFTELLIPEDARDTIKDIYAIVWYPETKRTTLWITEMEP